MTILEQTGGRRAGHARADEAGDRFIRFQHALRLHHDHPPALRQIEQRDEPESLDDCLIVTQQNIQQFRLEEPLRWASYPEIEGAMRARQLGSRAGHNVHYSRQEVFSPLKLVLAEADLPIRAALCYQPAYPWQCKLATRLPETRLWLMYAALAVLNSRLGQAFYEALVRERPPVSQKPHGLKAHAINAMPIARRDWEFQELGSVADLTHQVMTLHLAQSEFQEALGASRQPAERWAFEVERAYAGVFAAQTQAVSQRLDDALRPLLGLTESEESRLLADARPPKSRSAVHPRLFEEWELLPPPPPPPPVVLADELDSVSPEIPAPARRHLRRLLERWQENVNGRPPREFYVEERQEPARA